MGNHNKSFAFPFENDQKVSPPKVFVRDRTIPVARARNIRVRQSREDKPFRDLSFLQFVFRVLGEYYHNITDSFNTFPSIPCICPRYKEKIRSSFPPPSRSGSEQWLIYRLVSVLLGEVQFARERRWDCLVRERIFGR